MKLQHYGCTTTLRLLVQPYDDDDDDDYDYDDDDDDDEYCFCPFPSNGAPVE
jgi:hypothetical protein